MQGPSQLSREQQQALALAQAKRKRAEAEAQGQQAAPAQPSNGAGMGSVNPMVEVGQRAQQDAVTPASSRGLRQAGNIDLTKRPQVKNADGSISSVRSMSIGTDRGEVLIPTVSDDGRVMGDQEAIDYYRRTGRHLGIFDTPDNATAYAEAIHNQQANFVPRDSTIRPQDWKQPPAPIDPLAPIDPKNIALLEQKRQRDNEEAMAYEKSQRFADKQAQLAASYEKVNADEYYNSLSPVDRFRLDVSNAVKGGAAAAENAIFTPANTLLAKIDPNRQGADFIHEQVVPRAQAVGQMVDGGRLGGFPQAVTGGLTEWGATTARNPQQGMTEAVDMLEPTHVAARGYNNLVDAGGDVIDGNVTSDTNRKFQEGLIDLGTGTLGVIPAGSATVTAMRNAARAPARALEEQIARIAPMADDAARIAPATTVPPTRPAPAPVQPQPAAQAAPQPPAPVQTATAPPIPPQPPVGGPAVAAGAAGNPPGVPVAQAAQTPPPGTLTPAGNGVAVDSFNNLPVKTREGVLRAMEASGMTRQQAFDAIRSLNDLPPDRANMFEFELIRRFGGPDQFPNLQANLTAMGSDFSIQTAKKGGSPQEVMNKSLLDQAQSEGEYLIRMAEDIFGEGKVATKQELDTFRNQLGGQYQKQLAQTYPGMTRLRSAQAKLDLQARIDPARKELTEYLLRPEVMEDVPQWVRDQVMLQVADDLRFIRLDDAGQQFRIQQNPELAPLLTPDRPLRYSPQLWKTLVEMYPTQVGHSLQSAYRQAIDEAYSGISNAVDRTTAKKLKRMRGESRVRSNAADPNKRGYGLLHLLEQASPGYKEIRQQFGDVVGAQKAADMPNTFFRDAKDEEALANFIDVYDNELTPLQQEAVRNGITTQIRQALKNKTEFTQPWELDAIERGHLPNLTAVSSQPFLEALPRVFGRDGERMADAIRLSRANIDNIQAINKNFASGTPKGMEIRENAKNLYEHPSATNINPIDNATSTMAGLGLASAMAPGGQVISAAMLGGATMRGLYRAYKLGKSLTPGQKEALAEWLFKPRRATDAAPPTTPRRFSKIGYAGNVLTGAGVGAGVAAATGQDPTTGAVAGAFGGAARAGLRGMRAERSIIKPPPAGPRGGNRLRTGGNPPPAVGPRGARTLPGQTSPASATVTGALVGGGLGYVGSDGDPTATLAGAVGGGAAFGGAARLAKGKPRPAGNALKSGPAKAPPANVTALPKSGKANSSDLQKALQAYIDKPRTKWDDALEQGKINAAEYDWYSGGGTAEELQKTKANMLETLKTAEGYPADRVWEVYSKDPSAKMALELLAADGNQRAMAIRYEAERMRAIPRQTKRMWAIMGEPQVSVAPLADLAGSIGDDVAIETAKSFARMSEQPFLVARAKAIKTADEAYALLRDAHKLINGKDGRPAWADRLIRDARNNEGKFAPPKAKATPKADVVPFGAAQKAPPAPPPVKPSGAPKPPPVQNGFGDKATLASAGGGIAYGELGPLEDLNNDGVKDEKDRAAMRMKYGMGGIMTPLLVRGGVGMAKSLGNKLKGGKAPPMGKAPPAQSGFGGGNGPKAPPKPKGEGPGIVSRMVTGGATGVAVSLANDARAQQEDLAPKIARTEQDIANLKKAMADFDAIKDPRAKQQFLKDAGFYAGKIDGNIAGKTTEGMERWKAKQEAAMAAAEADMVELVRRDAYQKNHPDPYMVALRDYGPTVAGFAALFGLKYLRGSAAKKSIMVAEAEAKNINRLITKGPVKSFVNKADQSRPENLNTFWKKGGASVEELPFKQDSTGKWKPNPKAKPAHELFQDNGYWRAITKYVSGKDLSLILGGTIDAVGAQPFIDNANRKLKEAEEDWKNNPSAETFKRVEDAQNEIAMYTLVQRLGIGLAGGRLIGSIGAGYAKPRPNIQAAATEQAGIKAYIASKKAPPKPRGPKPPPQSPLPFGGGNGGSGNP